MSETDNLTDLPAVIAPGTKAFLFDPAGGRACRDGDPWCPVTLTGNESTWNRSDVRCVEIATSSGRGKWFDAGSIKISATTAERGVRE